MGTKVHVYGNFTLLEMGIFSDCKPLVKQGDNALGSVCLSICVCPSVWALLFEPSGWDKLITVTSPLDLSLCL